MRLPSKIAVISVIIIIHGGVIDFEFNLACCVALIENPGNQQKPVARSSLK